MIEEGEIEVTVESGERVTMTRIRLSSEGEVHVPEIEIETEGTGIIDTTAHVHAQGRQDVGREVEIVHDIMRIEEEETMMIDREVVIEIVDNAEARADLVHPTGGAIVTKDETFTYGLVQFFAAVFTSELKERASGS